MRRRWTVRGKGWLTHHTTLRAAKASVLALDTEGRRSVIIEAWDCELGAEYLQYVMYYEGCGKFSRSRV